MTKAFFRNKRVSLCSGQAGACRTQVYRLMPAKHPLAPPGRITQSAACGLLSLCIRWFVCRKRY